MTTIVLSDDHNIVRQGIKALLAAEPDMKVIAEAADASTTIALVNQHKPDVLVLDLMLGEIDGIDVVRQIVSSSPKTAIVILSMYSNEAYVVRALRAGAKAYVLKECTAEELATAVRFAVSGKKYLSATLSQQAINTYVKASGEVIQESYDTLTPREREVLHMVAHGHTNSEIAKRLSISPRTVEVHRANMMRKLGLNSHTDLMRYAMQNNIILPK
jgi:two-component system, NarL family, response regulator NreC